MDRLLKERLVMRVTFKRNFMFTV